MTVKIKYKDLDVEVSDIKYFENCIEVIKEVVKSIN